MTRHDGIPTPASSKRLAALVLLAAAWTSTAKPAPAQPAPAGPPFTVASDPTAHYPAVASSADGSFVVVWLTSRANDRAFGASATTPTVK